MRAKGISPIIAAVILIAIVITVGGIVSSWLYTFVDDSTHQTACAVRTAYLMSDATYNDTSGEIRIKVRNMGETELYNFSVEVDNGTFAAWASAHTPPVAYRLSGGRTQYIIADLSNENITNVNKALVLVGSCPAYHPSAVNVENI